MSVPLGPGLTCDEAGWLLVERGWDPDRSVAAGSNFLCGNGYLGYRGTTPEQGPDEFVALVVSDTYDCADGHWRELTTAPNPLFVAAVVDGETLAARSAPEVETSLDLRTGTFGARFRSRVDEAELVVEVERFASADDLHVLAQRWTLRADAEVTVEVDARIDDRIWSLNGEHLPDVHLAADDTVLTATGTTVESGVEVAVAARVVGPTGAVTVPAGGEIVIETTAAVVSSNDVDDPSAEARRRAGAAGYDERAEASAARWAEIWAAMDVTVEGDVADQVGLRFSAYHNRICTPAHTDRLPIGARGLSCQAYQGAAFWDQEVYNLPAFLFTEPEIARSTLVYRHRTLDGARRKAARLGYDGAFFAWISGDTGDELCPDVFFTDVLTGRPIRNHFNDWQMHVAPDVVTMIERYLDVTDDERFLVDHGAELAFEVARFLHSFVRYDEWRGVYHCIRLLGPDEWHENVDDNAFTNHQVRKALAFAVETHERLTADHPDALAELTDRIGLRPEEVDGWRRVRDRMLLPQPDDDTDLIEQFAGFFELEDVRPDEVRSRLLDPGEYWGWPNGVAVATQVSKQPDVVMLLWQQADAFGDDVARANYEYYEPRCAHGSTLSHAAHGMVAVRIGEIERAHDHFRRTAMVDLLNTAHAVVGGTFIGGIHTAACGGTYQLAVNGFGGLDVDGDRLTIDPQLPAAWSGLSYPVRWRGLGLRVRITGDAIEITADHANDASVRVAVRGVELDVAPGATASG